MQVIHEGGFNHEPAALLRCCGIAIHDAEERIPWIERVLNCDLPCDVKCNITAQFGSHLITDVDFFAAPADNAAPDLLQVKTLADVPIAIEILGEKTDLLLHVKQIQLHRTVVNFSRSSITLYIKKADTKTISVDVQRLIATLGSCNFSSKFLKYFLAANVLIVSHYRL